MYDRVVVVGTDGTDAGSAAVGWAAREAQRRGLALRIVHTCNGDGDESWFDVANPGLDIVVEAAEAVVGAARRLARESAPDLDIRTGILIGDPVTELVEASRGAEMLVLGDRGRRGVTGLLFRPVTTRMATRALCPLVVVRGRDDAGGPIVAGIGGSPHDEAVLEAAFAAAADEGCPLVVVRSYTPVVPLRLTGAAMPATDVSVQDAAEQDRLAARLAPWQARFPRVPVLLQLSHDSAAEALVRASRQARLVVLGSRGHGVLTGTVFGSTGLRLIHRAACPVQIMRAP